MILGAIYLETFGNTSSIPRAVARVLQTIEDWGFIQSEENYITIKKIEIQNEQVAEWFIKALVILSGPVGLSLSDLALIPEKLGIILPNPRDIVQHSGSLVLIKNIRGLDIIKIRK